MDIHPYVRKLMGDFATSEDELARWIAYHESVSLEDVEAECHRLEVEELLDAQGWD
jgi:hypothetical protein